MIKRQYKRYISSGLSLLVVLTLLFQGELSVRAAASSISGVDATITYTKGNDPTIIDSNMTVSANNFADGYIEIEPTQGFKTGDLLTINSDANPTASGAISIVGDTIYKGTGSTRTAIASVDSTYDGEDGTKLRINFSAPFTNGDFNQGSFSGWTTNNSYIALSGDTGTGISTSMEVTNNAGGVVSPDGTYFAKLNISGSTTVGFGTAHGPSILSSSFTAAAGDQVSFQFNAVDSGDDYDVFGYLVKNGVRTQILYERGDNTGGWLTRTANIATTGTYQFEFICGTYDATGGQAVGSTMYIDNAKLVSGAFDQTIANAILSRVSFSTTTSAVTTSVRKWRVNAKNSGGEVGTSAGQGTIQVKLDEPVLTITPSTTSMSIAASSTGATLYDFYRDGSLIASNQASPYNDVGRSPNVQYTYTAVAKNSGVDLASNTSSNFAKFTLATVPTISVTNRSNYTVNDLTLGANGNSGTTQYRIQRSTDNANWSDLDAWSTNLNGYTHSGLAEDTTYYYRVRAKNGDGTESANSASVSMKTNDQPIATANQPAGSVYKSEVNGYTTFTLSGIVVDRDGDQTIVSSTVNGVTRSTTVTGTAEGAAWSLVWEVIEDNLPENSFTALPVNVDDQTGKTNANSSSTWENTLYIDKTAPNAPTITNQTTYTNAARVPVAITSGADLGATASGTQRSEYRLSGAQSQAWTTYTDVFDITAAGVTVIEARTLDNVGNISSSSQSEVKIDRSGPTIGNFTLDATYGDTIYTRSRTVDLTGISSNDLGGAGDGTNPNIPDQMMISNDSNFTEHSGWIAYSSTYSDWVLTAGNGTKTVYMKFKDKVGNESTSFFDNIIYDDISPVLMISAPSRYMAKRGLTVTYTVTLDDASANLSGINVLDTAKIQLIGSGPVGEVIHEVQQEISVINVDATHRKVQIHLPENMMEEGTISFKILAEAAQDPAGNLSVEVPGNFSFNVDSTPPINQNILFPENIKVSGGQPVTLALTSEMCEGGHEGDSVRFAPIGYDGDDAANGTTITSTHGKSTVINAPTEDGNYRLYVVDAAGNISFASEHVLTVKNLGPTVSVEGPSKSYVQASNTVEYIITYSADAAEITLGEFEVGLIRSGTANAYVEIQEVADEPLQRKVILSNLMGEGSVGIKIAAGSGMDAIGNPAKESQESQVVYVDNTPATLDIVHLESNQIDHPTYVKTGETIQLNFTTSEVVTLVDTIIAGQPVSAKTEDGIHYTASYKIPVQNAPSDGLVTFSVITVDRAGNISESVSTVTDASQVTIDTIRPVVELTGDMDAQNAFYIGEVMLAYDEGAATLQQKVNDVIIATTNPVSGATLVAPGIYTLSVADAAGNFTVKQFIVSKDYVDLMEDYESLQIIYALGDRADYVTRDLQPLDSIGDNGSIISWNIVEGTRVSLGAQDPGNAMVSATATVTRPLQNENSETVILRATLQKGVFTITKDFAISVIHISADDVLSHMNEDVNTAQVIYQMGDSAGHVTGNVELSSLGVMFGNTVTWTSDSPYLTIGDKIGDNYVTTVERPLFTQGDVTVMITATIIEEVVVSDEEQEEQEDPVIPVEPQVVTKTFQLLILKQEGSESELANYDADRISIQYHEGDNSSHVTDNFTFSDQSIFGSNSTFTSSNSDLVYIDGLTGIVMRPGSGTGDQTVFVTATIVNGQTSVTRSFELLVVEEEESQQQNLLDAQADADALKIIYRQGDHKDRVTTHLVFPSIGARGSDITWTSNQAVVSNQGMVSRLETDTTVILTATIQKGNVSIQKSFTVKVIAKPMTLLLKLGNDADQSVHIYRGSDSAAGITQNLVWYGMGANQSVLTYNSSDENVISPIGVVTRGESDRTVTLTIMISQEEYIIYKSVEVTVLAQ